MNLLRADTPHTHLFPLPVWQQVDFNVGVGGATNVHGRQVLALDYRHVQDTTGEIVLNLETINVSKR